MSIKIKNIAILNNLIWNQIRKKGLFKKKIDNIKQNGRQIGMFHQETGWMDYLLYFINVTYHFYYS